MKNICQIHHVGYSCFGAVAPHVLPCLQYNLSFSLLPMELGADGESARSPLSPWLSLAKAANLLKVTFTDLFWVPLKQSKNVIFDWVT